MADSKSVVEAIIERYKHIPVNDLRETLRQVRQLKNLDLDHVPAPIVRLFHGAVVLGSHEEAPDWFYQFCEWVINNQRDGELEHQATRLAKDSVINDLTAQLGEELVDSLFARIG